MSAFAGLVVGTFLGLIAAFFAGRADRALRRPEEFGEVFAAPVLGTIPTSRDVASGSGLGALTGTAVEAFRLLRARLLYFGTGHDVKVLMVTSSRPGEGKSTVARYLADICSGAGERTIIIEADMRRPGIAPRLGPGYAGSAGLSGVLSGQATLDSAIQTTPDGTAFLSSGPTPPNPAELVESPAMAELLADLRERYDFVIVDTPPMSAVSDAIPLLRIVDGVLIIGRIGLTTTHSAQAYREQLSLGQGNVLGIVVNGIETRQGSAYGYGYDYSYSQTSAPPNPLDAPTDGAESEQDTIPTSSR
jgi:receptor protein-tyrosine kinase